MRKLVIAALVGAALAAAAGATVAPATLNGIRYLNGGIGQTEQQQMLAERPHYNLLLTFAARKSGAYRADVQVDIRDAGGTSVLSHPDSGPMLYVQLPPGTYRIRAAAEGKTFQRTVRLGEHGQRELVLHWEGDAEDDPAVRE
jgi:hypothetical protein